jgi:hypothetical protein
MRNQLRKAAWAIAEAWWRKHHRQAAGYVPEAESPAAYADQFWEGWIEEASAAASAFFEDGEPGCSAHDRLASTSPSPDVPLT